jgi:hypothetical protein
VIALNAFAGYRYHANNEYVGIIRIDGEIPGECVCCV